MAKTKKPVKKTAAKKAAKKSAPKLGDPIDSYNEIVEKVSAMQDDVEKFKEGNKASGRRLRKYAQEVKNLCGLIRKEIQNEINEM